MANLNDEMAEYLADYCLQKYEQAQILKRSDMSLGEFYDYANAVGKYEAASELLRILMEKRTRVLRRPDDRTLEDQLRAFHTWVNKNEKDDEE